MGLNPRSVEGLCRWQEGGAALHGYPQAGGRGWLGGPLSCSIYVILRLWSDYSVNFVLLLSWLI